MHSKHSQGERSISADAGTSIALIAYIYLSSDIKCVFILQFVGSEAVCEHQTIIAGYNIIIYYIYTCYNWVVPSASQLYTRTTIGIVL